MRVALVHDWLVAHRGGEAVLLELAHMFPDAPIYTLVLERDKVHPELSRREIFTSFIQDLPGSPAGFRRYLPLFPAAIERFDLSSYDLVLSTSHCAAKGVYAGDAPHISYIHTPMRYAWEQRSQYAPKGKVATLGRPVFELGAAWLRNWDRKSAQRPTKLLANSSYVANRISDCWGRTADVIYPPVDTDFYCPGPGHRKDYLAVVGAQVGYKNNALAVAFGSATGTEMRVVGTGPEIDTLHGSAGPGVIFEGHVSRERLREIYREARALLFCGVEDFGIVPVEAIACGCPVIAFGRGGALETVHEEDPVPTGVIFREPTMEGIGHACARLDNLLKEQAFIPGAMYRYAQSFSANAFREAVRCMLSNTLDS